MYNCALLFATLATKLFFPMLKHFSFCHGVEDASVFLPLLLPVVVARLGTQEITEPSEELRLSLVTLLTSVVGLCKTHMSPYLNDMVLILQRTIVDPFPEVKKVGGW